MVALEQLEVPLDLGQALLGRVKVGLFLLELELLLAQLLLLLQQLKDTGTPVSPRPSPPGGRGQVVTMCLTLASSCCWKPSSSSRSSLFWKSATLWSTISSIRADRVFFS